MILCQCTGTTDRDIARLCQEGVDSATAIALATGGAGATCAPCRREIVRLLTTGRDELPRPTSRTAAA